MMKKRNNFYFTFLVCFLIILSSCEAEKEYIENQENGKKMKRTISYEQFKTEINKPDFKLEIQKSSLARDISDFEIDQTQVNALETNKIVYSLKLKPKNFNPEKKFYNLVVYNSENEIIQEIVEYNPSQVLYDTSEDAKKHFLETSTQNIIYSSRTTTQPFCPVTITQTRCSCVGNHLSGDIECTCSVFVTQTYTQFVPCTNGGNDTDPSGGDNGDTILDPVLPEVNEDNCNDLKTKSYNQEFKNKMNELKNDSNGDVEKAFLTFANNPKYSTKYSGTPQDPSSIQIPLPSRTDCTGYMHCHLNDPAKKNFAIFSPDDFIAHDTLVGTSTNQQLVKNAMFVINEIQGTTNIYAIKITNKTKFDTMASQIEVFYPKYGKEWQDKIDYKTTPAKQVNQFLKLMKDNGWDDCFELYQSDANYQNWEQLTLNSSNNTIKIKC